MRKIENLLDDSLVRAGIEKEVTSLRVVKEVKKIFLRLFGDSSRYTIVPKDIRESMLVVEVRDECDISQIKNRENEILLELEGKLKKQTIKRLRFQLR